MRPAARFAAGLTVYLATAVYLELGAPGFAGGLSSVPQVGGILVSIVQVCAIVLGALVWTFSYPALFGGLVPKPRFHGKKMGECGTCGFVWEMGRGDASRFWFKTEDVKKGPDSVLRPRYLVARICPKCGVRLDDWHPVTDPKEAMLPDRLRTPKSYPR